jgi:membrane protease YdiL (CAAX protease family)
VIIACVCFTMIRVHRAYQHAADAGLSNPSAELQVQFSGKLAVGFNLIMGSGPTTKPTTNRTLRPEVEQYIHAMDKYAASANDRIRTIAVVAELQGTEPALKRIDQEGKTNDNGEAKQDLQTLRQIYQNGADSIDPSAKQKLIEHHGFFGKLAATYGAPSIDPMRNEVIATAQHATVIAIVIGVVVVVLGIIVLGAVITAIVLAAVGQIRLLYQRQPAVNSAFLEAFALSLLLMILVGFVMRVLKMESLAWEWVMLVLIPAMMFWVRSRGIGPEQTREGLGWYWGRGPWVEIPCGLLGYFAGVPIIIAGIFLSLLLSKHVGATPMHPIQQMLQGNKWHVLNLYCAASIVAPIVEETMFRGAFFNHMRRRWNWLISAGLVALVFAAIHPQGWTFIPALGSIAIVLAAIREWRGSLWGSIAAHATNNTIVLTLALLVAR